MKYATKNRLKVIECLKAHEMDHLNIEEIVVLMGNEVPVASLYRIIDSLVEEGIVRKYIIDNKTPACFQYVGDGLLHSHFHLICTKCGRLFHLECEEVNHLVEHIQEEHDFQIDVSKVNLYGVCEECQNKQ